MHQVGDQTKVILRCTVNQPSTFAMLNKQDRYTNTRRSKQHCIKPMRPSRIIKPAGSNNLVHQVGDQTKVKHFVIIYNFNNFNNISRVLWTYIAYISSSVYFKDQF